jgi:hypothetical protein
MNKTAIEQGAGKQLFRSIVPELNSYIGGPFEDICLQYMIRMNNRGALPFIFINSGRWWGANPATKASEEIDLVFSDQSHQHLICAECKWRNDLKDVSVLEGLIEKAALLPGYEHISFYLFSKAGFSKSCQTLAKKKGNVSLIGLSGLFKI